MLMIIKQTPPFFSSLTYFKQNKIYIICLFLEYADGVCLQARFYLLDNLALLSTLDLIIIVLRWVNKIYPVSYKSYYVGIYLLKYLLISAPNAVMRLKICISLHLLWIKNSYEIENLHLITFNMSLLYFYYGV